MSTEQIKTTFKENGELVNLIDCFLASFISNYSLSLINRITICYSISAMMYRGICVYICFNIK